MKHCFLLLTHLVVLFTRLLTPNGFRAIVAENLALKQQLLIIKRSRHKAPNLHTSDRFIFAWLSLWMTSKRIIRSAIIIKPATILRFHQALVRKKYSKLYSRKTKGKPGLKGPDPELIKAIVAINQRNPQYGSPRIAMIISHIFGIDINKDIVRRILQSHYKPDPSQTNGPSWLSFIGNMKNSLWSVDLFRCESITLKSHWVMVVMDIWSRKFIGFAVHQGPVDGPTVCRLFNQSTAGKEKPRFLISDNDPLFNTSLAG